MLTPEEIFEKEFKRKFKGYDVDEVNEFLDQVIRDFLTLTEENKLLKKENKQLKSSTSRQDYRPSQQISVAEKGKEDVVLKELLKRVESLEKKAGMF